MLFKTTLRMTVSDADFLAATDAIVALRSELDALKTSSVDIDVYK